MNVQERVLREIYEKVQDINRWPEVFFDYMAPQLRVEHNGRLVYEGDDHGLAFLRGWLDASARIGITANAINVRTIAANESTGIVEHADTFIGTDGEVLVTLSVASVFVFAGDKIVEVREYADTGAYHRLASQAGAQTLPTGHAR